jgi:hypothetical protein
LKYKHNFQHVGSGRPINKPRRWRGLFGAEAAARQRLEAAEAHANFPIGPPGLFKVRFAHGGGPTNHPSSWFARAVTFKNIQHMGSPATTGNGNKSRDRFHSRDEDFMAIYGARNCMKAIFKLSLLSATSCFLL